MLLLGKKLGMTRIFNEEGVSLPVTVLEVGPCIVTQVRTADKDGYSAVQVGWGDAKPRRSTMAVIGHDSKAGSGPKKFHREFLVAADKAAEYTLGQELNVSALEGSRYVDVTATSKGKGFQGAMKRHNFKGLCASHGTERKHRSPGSIASYATNRGFSGKLKKGKKMPGHMGAERVTVRSLDVIKLDTAQNLVLVKGPVPGANEGFVMVRPASRVNRSKAKKIADAAKK